VRANRTSSGMKSLISDVGKGWLLSITLLLDFKTGDTIQQRVNKYIGIQYDTIQQRVNKYIGIQYDTIQQRVNKYIGIQYDTNKE
jgi:hypothetical protein